MTLAIGFDTSAGILVIAGNGVFPARSLTACPSTALPGYIQINDLGGRGEQHLAWNEVTSLDGSYTPSTIGDALAYLQAEFAKTKPVGETFGVPVVAGANLTQGQPVAVSRASGQLLPARADTYMQAFVAGVASSDTVQGFTNQPAHGAVTLLDWTGLTGSAALSVGLPYFLALSGGLTPTPDRTTGNALTRVGIATAPNTLVVEPVAPILL